MALRRDLAGLWLLAVSLLSGWSQNAGVRSCDAFLWTLTNYDTNADEVSHVTDVETGLSRHEALIGLVKFSFLRDGEFEVNATATIVWRDADIGETVAAAAALANVNATSLGPELLVCNVEEYLQLYEQETGAAGSFCASRFNVPGFCERFPSRLVQRDGFTEDGATIVGRYTIELESIALRDEGTKFFVLSVCDFVHEFDAPSSTQLRARANFKLVNSGGEIFAFANARGMLRNGMVVVFVLLLLGLTLWRSYIRRWQPYRNTEIQVRIGYLLALKACTIAAVILQLTIGDVTEASASGHDKAVSVVTLMIDFGHVVALTGFCASLLVLVLELALGRLVIRQRLSPADIYKVRRMTGTFVFALLLYLVWDHSLIAWILLCFAYVIITSSAHFLAATTVRVLQQQSNRIQVQLDMAAHESAIPLAVIETLQRRQSFIDDVAAIFRSLRVGMVTYFCFAPFVLLMVQITMMSTESASFVLGMLSEIIDIAFLARIAFLYRFVSFEKYLDPRLPEQDAVSAASSSSSFALSDVTASATAVYPVFNAQDDDDDDEKVTVQAAGPDRAAGDNGIPAVICVTAPGQSLRIGVLNNYEMLEDV